MPGFDKGWNKVVDEGVLLWIWFIMNNLKVKMVNQISAKLIVYLSFIINVYLVQPSRRLLTIYHTNRTNKANVYIFVFI